MNTIEKLNDFERQIKEAHKLIDDLIDKRIDWARDNSKEIKKLFPVKTKFTNF